MSPQRVTPHRVVLKRSQRDSILWHFFVVLDRVEEGPSGKLEFASEVLAAFGVSLPQRDEWAKRVCEHLPDDFRHLDGNAFMEAFERASTIEWDNDLHDLDAAQSRELEHSVLSILAARTPEQLPREVSGLVIEALKRVAGSRVDAEALLRAASSLEDLFVRELWRSKDAASQARLTEQVFHHLKRTAQVELDSAARDHQS